MPKTRILAVAVAMMVGVAMTSLGVFSSTPAAAAPAKLSWAPPALTNPATVYLSPTFQNVVLDSSRDYRLVITQPLTAPGGLIISGGRNVVLIGGKIVVPSAASEPDATKRRALYLKNQTGTIHIEGLHLSGTDIAEGINLDERNGATVQLQNIKVDTVHGTLNGNHADVIQTWAGPTELRVDRLEGATDYQGLFLLPDQLWQGTLRPWTLRNVDITGTPESGYLVWKDNAVTINSSNVTLHKTNNATNKVFWPNATAWPGASIATPTSSVLSGTPGMSYVSPGYTTDVVASSTTTTSTTSTTLPPTTTTTTTVPTTTTTTAPPVAAATKASVSKGYWMVSSDGGVFSFGDAKFLGSTGGMRLNRPVVGLAGTPTGSGYWLVASDGGIFSFGDAKFLGSTGSIRLNQPIVGMASTASGDGYWLVASDGGIFAFGDAAFQGSTGSMRLNQPIVGLAKTPTGNGYWLVASDGGIFSFGDAKFLGSTGSIRLNQPIVGMAATPSGNGYWLVAADGGIFNFGDASFYGSAVGAAKGRVTGIQSTPSGRGYWIQSSTGWSAAYGDAVDHGSIAGPLSEKVVGAASSFGN